MTERLTDDRSPADVLRSYAEQIPVVVLSVHSFRKTLIETADRLDRIAALAQAEGSDFAHRVWDEATR